MLSGPTAALGRKQSPSSWAAPQFYVGGTGTGSVLIEGGANLTTMATELGGNAGSVGQVTLTGSGSSWDVGVTHFYIGAGSGEGILTLLDHASINYFSELNIAYSGTSRGTVTVDNSTLHAASLDVGDGGNGTLHVRNGGAATAGSTFVAYYSKTIGTVNVEGVGTTLGNTNSTVIGRYGTATVNVIGGAVIDNGANTVVGDDSGSGNLRVSGLGSKVTNDGSFRAGAAAGSTGHAITMLDSGAVIQSATTISLLATSEMSFTASEDGDAGLLSAGTTATLGGSLAFHLQTGYQPPLGSFFDIITAQSITGTFSSFSSDVPANLIYAGSKVTVQIVPEPAGCLVIAGVGVLILVSRRARACKGANV